MAGTISSGKLSGLLEKIIREHLYPEKEFPTHLFPDLIPILVNLFIKEKKNRKKVTLNTGATELGNIKEEVISLLNLNSLMKDHSDVVILIYRNIIINYVSRKHFNKGEIDDIVQEIITEILGKKIGRIRDTFNFTDTKNPTFTSYFMVTIRNIYIDMLRKRKLSEKEVNGEMTILNAATGSGEEAFANLIIDEELQKLKMLLSLYRKNKARIILILKIKYHQKPTGDEIMAYFGHCSKSDIELLTSDFSTLYERRIFEIIAPVFSGNSSQELKPDSLRKWISGKIGEIKDHMNNTHPNNPYDHRNISDLFMIFFNRQKQIGRMKNVS